MPSAETEQVQWGPDTVRWALEGRLSLGIHSLVGREPCTLTTGCDGQDNLTLA